MDYMFSYGPFSHTGLKADIGLGGKSALMIGVANPSDNVTTHVFTQICYWHNSVQAVQMIK